MFCVAKLSFRTFPLALDVGSGRGYIAPHLTKVLALHSSNKYVLISLCSVIT